MPLAQMRIDLDERIAKLRRIKRILESEDCYIFNKTITDQQHDHLADIIKSGDDIALKEFIVGTVEEELGTMSLRSLRKIAKARRIRNYYSLPRPILLSELANVHQFSSDSGDSSSQSAIS